MSFQRPTESSVRRAQTAQGGAVQHHGSRDSSRRDARVDTGLQSRLQTSSLQSRRGRGGGPNESPCPPPSTSSSLREFAARCDATIKRAQAATDSSRELEADVLKGMEERLSQSPGWRSATPSPPLSQGQAGSAAFLPPATTTTTAASPYRWFRSLSPTPRSREASINQPPASPSPPPLAAPPTTPAEEEGSPSLLQRLRQSLHRSPPPPSPQHHQPLFGHAGVSPYSISSEASVPPSEVVGGTAASHHQHHVVAAHASPRKSVRFVSPDKLETVTPTKVVALSSSDSTGSDADDHTVGKEGEDAAAATQTASALCRPPAKRARTERTSGREGEERWTSPHRGSVAFLPPPPRSSAVKAPVLDGSGTSESLATLSPLTSSSSQRTYFPRASPRASAGSRTSLPLHSYAESDSESVTARGTGAMGHAEVAAFVTRHTIKQSLAHLRVSEMVNFLRAAGSPLAARLHAPKRRLLAEVRAVIRQQGDKAS